MEWNAEKFVATYRGLAHSGGSDVKNCTPLWREAHVQVNMYKTPTFWSTFRLLDVKKVSDR